MNVEGNKLNRPKVSFAEKPEIKHLSPTFSESPSPHCLSPLMAADELLNHGNVDMVSDPNVETIERLLTSDSNNVKANIQIAGKVKLKESKDIRSVKQPKILTNTIKADEKDSSPQYCETGELNSLQPQLVSPNSTEFLLDDKFKTQTIDKRYLASEGKGPDFEKISTKKNK